MLLLMISMKRAQTWLRGWLTPARILTIDIAALIVGAIVLRALLPDQLLHLTRLPGAFFERIEMTEQRKNSFEQADLQQIIDEI